MSEWQPIETAPKDGTRIWVLSVGDIMDTGWEKVVRSPCAYIAHWNPEGDSWVDANGDLNGDIDHLEVTGSWFCDGGGWLQPNEVSHWLPYQPASLGARLRELREQKGWTQQHLAVLAMTKQPSVSRLENPGNEMMSLATLSRMAEALECELTVSLTPHVLPYPPVFEEGTGDALQGTGSTPASGDQN